MLQCCVCVLCLGGLLRLVLLLLLLLGPSRQLLLLLLHASHIVLHLALLLPQHLLVLLKLLCIHAMQGVGTHSGTHVRLPWERCCTAGTQMRPRGRLPGGKLLLTLLL